ncbi:MAG TPA: hypothetical protein PKD68_05470, partial [Candidatus Saccharibacteria bacterium]|nr:hypothetical protein [Candidatus Saccharibacteria bacterium]
TIRGGRIIRPGFYRQPDGSGVNYANQIANADENTCVFCPELTQTITYEGEGFTVTQAAPQYAHFDAQEVASHELLIPDAHVDSLRRLGKRAVRRINEFICEYEDQTPSDQYFQDYTRRAANPSKSIEHVHTHLFRLSRRPVGRFAFGIHYGVAALEFADLTTAQLDQLNRSRPQV